MIFFTADNHFGHANIIRLCGRPFADVQEMDLFMLEVWNAKVGGNDTVYILGDLFFRHRDPEGLLRRLRGKKRLITGNHDLSWMKGIDCSKYFVSVDPFLEGTDGAHSFVLCHYPLMTWNQKGKRYMIHGHIHNDTRAEYWPLIRNDPMILNAGADINGFCPVTFDEMRINNDCFKQGLRIAGLADRASADAPVPAPEEDERRRRAHEE